MPTIYLVRHGQTDWNAALRLQGREDTPLNHTGRAQARRNGEVLAQAISRPERFRFISSPLMRTRETMEIVRTAMGMPASGYDTDNRLMEIHFGEWQGRTWEELREDSPEAIAARFDDPWNTVAPGRDGESFAMVSARALDWLKSVSQDAVVVSHGGIIRCVRGHLERTPQGEIPLVDIPQDRVYVLNGDRIETL